MKVSVDEAEHSIEMQLPYIAQVMKARSLPFTVIPILVGSLSESKEAEIGRILAPYFLVCRLTTIVCLPACLMHFTYARVINRM
jgi:AmmeMemoRadiSam system protein B